MRYVLTFIRSMLRERLTDIRSWAVTLLLPGLVLAALGLMPRQEASAPVQVGVALPESGGESLWMLLEARGDDVITFIQADTDTIDRNIAAGRWDCGLVLAEDFDARLEALDTDRIVTIRVGPGSAVYPLVRETVAASMAQLCGPGIAREYLLDSGMMTEESIAGVQPRLEAKLGTQDRILVTVSTPDGSPMSPLKLAQRGMDGILCWLIGVLIMIRLMLGAKDLGNWIRRSAAVRLKPLRAETELMIARIGADGILTLLSGCAAMLLLGKGGAGCWAVVCYGLLWLSFGILLAHFGPVSDVLPVCVPFAAVLNLLLSGALVDISRIVPALAVISRWSPAAIFLRVSSETPLDGCLLLAATGVCLLLSRAVDRLRRGRAKPCE